MNFPITPIAISDLESFRECLDVVAREREFLSIVQAPPLEQMRAFVSGNISNSMPQVVAKDGGRVVGWCDIVPGWQSGRRHCGTLGMGLLPKYRGKGLGRQLMEAALLHARPSGITRVELEVRMDNANALRLYERMGFEREGTKRQSMRIDGQYFDTFAMALLLASEA